MAVIFTCHYRITLIFKCNYLWGDKMDYDYYLKDQQALFLACENDPYIKTFINPEDISTQIIIYVLFNFCYLIWFNFWYEVICDFSS